MEHARSRESSAPPKSPGFDGDASFREDYLQVMMHFGLTKTEAATLVETCARHAFSTCGRTGFVPVLDELLAVASLTTGSRPERVCGD
jgi:hypothetical protein